MAWPGHVPLAVTLRLHVSRCGGAVNYAWDLPDPTLARAGSFTLKKARAASFRGSLASPI
eukprot:2757086-Rhodomonas_salina.2